MERDGKSVSLPCSKKSILFASATDKNSIPEEPCQEYKNLLEAPKAQANSLLKFGVSKRNGTQVVDSASVSYTHLTLPTIYSV